MRKFKVLCIKMFQSRRIFCIYFTLFTNGEGLTTPQGMKWRVFNKHEFSFLIPPQCQWQARVLFLIKLFLLYIFSSSLNVSFTFENHLWSQVEEVDALPACIAASHKCLEDEKKKFPRFLRRTNFHNPMTKKIK